MRRPALMALAGGAAGSFALMLYSGRNAPLLLIVLFTIWVLSPFAALAVADALSTRWSLLTRKALYTAMLIVAAASLAIYGADAMRPPRPQAAFVFVIVAPVSWLLAAVIIASAAMISRGRSSREGR